jgi:hypothetical protein
MTDEVGVEGRELGWELVVEVWELGSDGAVGTII